MKNNLKGKKIICILLIALILITTKVYAANDSFETTLTANSTQAKAEDTITITIGLSNIAIESGEKGIGGYTGSIKFDPSDFEYVSTNATDKWEAPFYQNGLITGNTKNGEVVNTAQSIGTITFKVKKDAKIGETNIQLTNFSGSTAVTDVVAANKAIKITIVGNNNGGTTNNGDNNNQNNVNNNSSNNNSNINANKTTNTFNNTSKGDNTTVKQSKLPKTGTANTIIFTVIGISILIAAIFFIRMIVINKKIK